MAVDDVCILRVVGRYQSQNIVNTMHWKITSQETSENLILGVLVDAWETAFETDWLSNHIASYTLVGLKAFRKTGPAKTPAFTPIGSVGTVVGTELPSSVCRTITLYSDSAKFRRRGRLMLSGSATAMFETDDGSVTAATIVLLNDIGALCLAGLEAGGDSFEMVLPATLVDPVVNVIDAQGRPTPSSIRSRRIRQFLVG